MDFNFFEWIRQGVKKSVLLGVSDAVNQMGMPHSEEETKDKLLGFLQSDNTPKVTGTSKRRLTLPSDSPRKLGRSITDIHPSTDDAGL
ncbi:MAG: hypothetical protein PHQ75_05115 [Thermoguttaceae bacterium]|nr:hypothetical protein [Thermoguttaceae bacterium]